MAKTAIKTITRMKRKVRVRKKVLGTVERPRLNVFKSARHIYALMIQRELLSLPHRHCQRHLQI